MYCKYQADYRRLSENPCSPSVLLHGFSLKNRNYENTQINTKKGNIKALTAKTPETTRKSTNLQFDSAARAGRVRKCQHRLDFFDGKRPGYRVGLVFNCSQLVAKACKTKHVMGSVGSFQKIEPSGHRASGSDEFEVEYGAF